MAELEYVKFSAIDPLQWLPLLNDAAIRKHLIGHALFDAERIEQWVAEKLEMDATAGCRVRAILCAGQLIGWCGIQPAVDGYEIALVVDRRHWGVGLKVFPELMAWAKALGHTELFVHFLHSRKEYAFLRKKAKRVYQSEMLGERFTTYLLSVS